MLNLNPKEDAKTAIAIIENGYNGNIYEPTFDEIFLKKDWFNTHCPFFSFTNENLALLYQELEINKKDILTIASSGDHIFNAILMDAKRIDAFDINIFTVYYLYLKVAAIQKLSNHEFNNIFLYQGKLNFDAYKKIQGCLPPEIQEFWNIVFHSNKIKNSLKATPLIINNPLEHRTYKNNPYLLIDNYYILREKLGDAQVNFILTSLTDLPNVLTSKYDLMFLSNINNYLRNIFDGDYINEYKKFILHSLSSYLNKDGKIQIAHFGANETHFDEKEIENAFEGHISTIAKHKDKFLVYKTR